MSRDDIDRECSSWPAFQRECWRRAFAGPIPASWGNATRRTRAYVWTLYLQTCAIHGLPLTLLPAGMAAFARACQGRGVTPRSFHAYARAIAAVAAVVEPGNACVAQLEDRNRRWAAIAQWSRRRKTAVLGRTPSADALFAVALEVLTCEARALDGADPGVIAGQPRRDPGVARSLVRFRRALVLALLLACPERRSAMAKLEIGDLEPTTITYRGQVTKTGRDNKHPLPDALRDHLQRYLRYRALFDPTHDRFWIQLDGGREGEAAGGDTIYRDVRSITRELAGVALWPHLLRDKAATLARDQAPGLARLASSVLNHRDERTTAIYGRRADVSEALASLQQAVERALSVPVVAARAGGVSVDGVARQQRRGLRARPGRAGEGAALR